MIKQLLALVFLAHSTASAQSAWRLVQTTDDLTGAGSDRRLIVRADDWPATPPTTADGYRGATIVLVCGDRVPGSAGRSLLFNAGQALQPFGPEFAYAKLRFDNDSTPISAYLTMFDPSRVTFLGDPQNPHFSPRLFGRLLGATKLTITFRAFGGDRMVSFHVAGLRAALAQVPACHWTD